MRKQFVNSVTEIFERDKRVVLLLGDIGVHGFKNILSKYSDRAYNIGILEQSTVGIAAGLSAAGFIPIVHTIAPFLVERALEQIKIDFGYQELAGNLISVGASYDYAGLGCTHHCPGDINILKTIPNIKIFVPGHSSELDFLMLENYSNQSLNYFRLSEGSNREPVISSRYKAKLIKSGSKGVVLVFGPFLSRTLDAVADLDVTVLYYNVVAPFDYQSLYEAMISSSKVVAVMPFYENSMSHDILTACGGKSLQLKTIGVPLKFADGYGTVKNHDELFGLNTSAIREKIINFIK